MVSSRKKGSLLFQRHFFFILEPTPVAQVIISLVTAGDIHITVYIIHFVEIGPKLPAGEIGVGHNILSHLRVPHQLVRELVEQRAVFVVVGPEGFLHTGIDAVGQIVVDPRSLLWHWCDSIYGKTHRSDFH